MSLDSSIKDNIDYALARFSGITPDQLIQSEINHQVSGLQQKMDQVSKNVLENIQRLDIYLEEASDAIADISLVEPDEAQVERMTVAANIIKTNISENQETLDVCEEKLTKVKMKREILEKKLATLKTSLEAKKPPSELEKTLVQAGANAAHYVGNGFKHESGGQRLPPYFNR